MNSKKNENTPEKSTAWKVLQCEVCGWIYDEEKGSPEEGLNAGTRWEEVPSDWTCPECLASKADFVMVEITTYEVTESDLKWRKPTEDSRFDNQPIVIIGTGLAGYDLIKQLREQGDTSEVIMITADDGDYYPKPVISHGISQNRSAGDITRASAAEMATKYSVQILTQTQVQAIATREQQLEFVNSQQQVQHQGYRKLVLATGARCIVPPFDGSGQDKIYQINNLDDYTRFKDALEGKQRVLVIGGGLIGCEYANDLATAGKEVTVVEALEAPLASLLPKEASDAVREGLEAAGISFHFGSLAKQVDNTDDSAVEGVMVTLDNGDKLEADLVLVAIGVQPNLDLARQAGLNTNRGIEVNRFLESSEINVFAIGDSAEVQGMVLPFVMPLTAQVRALARTLVELNTEVEYGVMPVHVKTPAVPIIFYCAPSEEFAHWEVERKGSHCKALCKTASGRLLGIALTGDYVEQKNNYMRLLPPIIGENFILPNDKETPDSFYRRPQGLLETLSHTWWGA